MIKTLVIHPSDRSTDFLKPIYDKIGYKTVLSQSVEYIDFLEELRSHERIMAMGHGSPMGLFNIGLFPYGTKSRYGGAICAVDVPFLKGKDNIYIWCNADDFVVEHQLTGFYSGMFISEVGEAHMMGVRSYKPMQKLVDYSNEAFAEILGAYAHLPCEDIYYKVKHEYGKVANHNAVAKYNCDRLYYNNGHMAYMSKPIEPEEKFVNYIGSEGF